MLSRVWLGESPYIVFTFMLRPVTWGMGLLGSSSSGQHSNPNRIVSGKILFFGDFHTSYCTAKKRVVGRRGGGLLLLLLLTLTRPRPGNLRVGGSLNSPLVFIFFSNETPNSKAHQLSSPSHPKTISRDILDIHNIHTPPRAWDNVTKRNRKQTSNDRIPGIGPEKGPSFYKKRRMSIQVKSSQVKSSTTVVGLRDRVAIIRTLIYLCQVKSSTM